MALIDPKHMSPHLQRYFEDSLKTTDGVMTLMPDTTLLDRIRTDCPILNGAEQPKEVDLTKTETVITIKLTPAEQRTIVEMEKRGPVFRMWLTPQEHARLEDVPDYTHGQLSDGRFFIWRPQSVLQELLASSSVADHALARHIQGRIIHDDNVE